MNYGLPGPEFPALIHQHTGDISEVRPAARGFGSDLTAVVECAKGPFFVKAMRNRPGGRRDSIVREKLINPFVQPLSPAMLWHAQDDQWIVLGFEVIEGRPSSFKPDSRDQSVIVGLLNRIGDLGLPNIARGWPETRWDRFAAEGEKALFRGDALLHTDINPDNLISGPRGPWVVDWSWPTRGAAFIDPACLVVQLVRPVTAPSPRNRGRLGARRGRTPIRRRSTRSPPLMCGCRGMPRGGCRRSPGVRRSRKRPSRGPTTGASW